jgi:hypothetical protein
MFYVGYICRLILTAEVARIAGLKALANGVGNNQLVAYCANKLSKYMFNGEKEHTIEPVPILHRLVSTIANRATWTAAQAPRAVSERGRLSTAPDLVVIDSVSDVLSRVIWANLLLSTMG